MSFIKGIYIGIVILFSFHSISYGQFNSNGVVAHRGAWKAKNLPQNSIASLKEAVDLGCYAAEFDVHLTIDNIPVVNHDHDFKGIPIETSTYKQLQAKKMSNGESLPTLKEYIIEALKDPHIVLWPDIKNSRISDARTIEIGKYSAEVVKELGAEDRVEFIGPNFEVLVKILVEMPNGKVLYIGSDKDPEVLKSLGFYGVDLGYKRFNSGEYSVSKSKQAGLRVGVYTVNEESEMRNQLKSGVDFITTNEPELLLNIHKEYSKNSSR